MIWLLIHDIRTRIQNAVLWLRWLPTYFFCPYINAEHEWLRWCDLNLYEEEFMGHKVIRKKICNYRNCPRMRGEE